MVIDFGQQKESNANFRVETILKMELTILKQVYGKDYFRCTMVLPFHFKKLCSEGTNQEYRRHKNQKKENSTE